MKTFEINKEDKSESLIERFENKPELKELFESSIRIIHNANLISPELLIKAEKEQWDEMMSWKGPSKKLSIWERSKIKARQWLGK